jgi:5-methylthioadenosine/S-adenosylhomocysteine deaminase
MNRILLKGGAIVTMDPVIGDLPKGDVLIENDRIAAVATHIAESDAQIIDAVGMLVLPGLINGHLHTWQTALRGLAADWTVAEYMQAMHRGLATVFKPEDIYVGNLAGALNQINNGVTTLVDWCHNNPTPAHTDAAIEGLDESGIRAVFLHGSPKPDPKPGQKHFSESPMPRSEVERLLKGRFASADGLVTMGGLAILGPYYSTYDVSRQDTLLARELGLIASMHYGGGAPKAPGGLERLLDEGLVGEGFNIVHGNDVQLASIRRVVDSGGTFTVTADIELQTGYGDPLTGILRELRAPIAIGTDVEPAVGSDMFTCMRMTLQHERHRTITNFLGRTGERLTRTPVTCREALSWASMDAAKVHRIDYKVGSLTPGKAADVTVLRATDLNMVPMQDLVGCAVMQASVANVDTVMIAGKILKRDGKLLAARLSDTLAKLRESGARLLADFHALPRRAA